MTSFAALERSNILMYQGGCAVFPLDQCSGGESLISSTEVSKHWIYIIVPVPYIVVLHKSKSHVSGEERVVVPIVGGLELMVVLVFVLFLRLCLFSLTYENYQYW